MKRKSIVNVTIIMLLAMSLSGCAASEEEAMQAATDRAWSINYAGRDESSGVTIEIARLVVGYKDAIEELTGQDFSQGSELVDWSEIQVVGELVLKVTNNAEVIAWDSPHQGTVQIDGEQIHLRDFIFWNTLFSHHFPGNIPPGVTNIGGVWFGIQSKTPSEITEVIYRYGRYERSYGIVITVEDREWQEPPDELK